MTGFSDRGAAKLLAVVPAVSFPVPGLPERQPGGSAHLNQGRSREGQRGLCSCAEGPGVALRADPAAPMVSVTYRYLLSDVREKLALRSPFSSQWPGSGEARLHHRAGYRLERKFTKQTAL